MLRVQRLQLELARIDREIQAALPAQPGAARPSEAGAPRRRGRARVERPRRAARWSAARGISGLAARRAEVKHEFDRAYAQVLEETGTGAVELGSASALGRFIPSAGDNTVHGSHYARAAVGRAPVTGGDRSAPWLHEATVVYWVKKYGLRAVNRSKHAARGPLSRDDLARLVGEGASTRRDRAGGRAKQDHGEALAA